MRGTVARDVWEVLFEIEKRLYQAETDPSIKLDPSTDPLDAAVVNVSAVIEQRRQEAAA